MVDASHGDHCCDQSHMNAFRLVAPSSIHHRVVADTATRSRVTFPTGITRLLERPPRIV